MSAPPARGYLSISEVLEQLRADFPDVRISKIRFLETEGLIEPARAPSGYRRFDAADVDRLRYILTAQRDEYLPLRVIRERLGRAGGSPGGEPGGAPPAGELTRRELLDRAGITEPQLAELEAFGLLRKAGRLYGPDALEVARAAAALGAYGVQPRHLRAVRASVEREVTLIEDIVAPILKQRGAGARDLAGQTAAELGALTTRLHRALIEGALAEAGLSAGTGPAGPGPAGRGSAGPGSAGPGPAARGPAGPGPASAGPAAAGHAGASA
jgi:DNA-binding transcriptional MerR regulator